MTDIKKLFEIDLPAAMITKAKEVKELNGTLQVNITGEGEWFIDGTSKGPSVLAGQGKADCTITISAANFKDLLKSPNKAMGMVLLGRLKIAGDKSLAMKLTKLFN